MCQFVAEVDIPICELQTRCPQAEKTKQASGEECKSVRHELKQKEELRQEGRRAYELTQARLADLKAENEEYIIASNFKIEHPQRTIQDKEEIVQEYDAMITKLN